MGKLCAEHVMSGATRVTVPCFLQGAVLAHRKLFSSCLEVESDGPPPSAPDGSDGNIRCPRYRIFYISPLLAELLAAVLVMLAWICILCFVIYLLILAVSLFIRALSPPLARRRPTMSGGSAESGCWGARPDAFACGRP